MTVCALIGRGLSLGLTCLCLIVMPRPVEAQQRDLNLVLAFDVSASVNDAEFALQRAGTARALRSERVTAAIEAAPGGIAVAIIQWSSIGQQAIGLDWVTLSEADEVHRYAEQVAALPRRLPGGGTMIHAGLKFAQDMFETAPGPARRYVIDVSGNGQTDNPEALAEQRDRLVARGVVINGLAIEEDLDDLTAYFYTHVIGGQQAFVETANDWEDFAVAMERKLYREISGAVFSHDAPTGLDAHYAFR